MKKINLAITISLLSLIANAEPNVDMELAGKHACTACHKIDEKLIGPSYNDVYEKYKDDPNAETYLINKVTNGGSGVWGDMPMTPNAHVPADVIQTLVKQILGK